MKRAHAVTLGAVVLAAGIGAATWLAPSRSIRREPHLPAPGHLPDLARALLRKRMLRHAESIVDVTWRTLVLDFDGVSAAIQPILDEPALARALPDDESQLNLYLPARFFVLQDELKDRARLLQGVARERDAGKLADAFGQLFRTCMSCHQIYAQARPGGV